MATSGALPAAAHSPHAPSLYDRAVAACGASIIAALVVNPLDVVKTRMQAQSAAESLQRLPAVTAEQQLLRLADLRGCSCPAPVAPQALKACYASPECGAFGSTLDGVRKIARKEGLLGLWRGVDVALLMAVPTVGIYLPLYEALMAHVQPSVGEASAPLVAGSLSRAASILCTSPLELLRTRLQASGSSSAGGEAGAAPRRQALAASLAALPKGRRLRAMWTGVGATLARDVPFSALYWGTLEPIRRALLPRPGHPASRGQLLAANLAAGSLGGALAAVVTTPLDVVKTRTQLGGARQSVLATLRAVYAEGGTPALFAGLGPRAARAAPSCAIVLTCYEVLKASGRPLR